MSLFAYTNVLIFYCVQLPQVKQQFYFTQFIAINDEHTSNLPSIYVKSKCRGIGQERGRERQREWIRGEREVALVER